MSYYIGYLSENCHHNHGSDSASYSINEGSVPNLPNYKTALEEFNKLVFTGEYFEIHIFDSSDKLLKSYSNY